MNSLDKCERKSSLRHAIVVGVACCFSMIFTQQAHANVIVWENVPFANSSGGYGMTNAFLADDFLLTTPQTLSSFQLYAAAGTNPFDEYFNGTIGWGIYTNTFGRPDQLLYSGSDSSLTLTPANNVRVFKIDGDFDLPDLTLQPGRYWFAAKEGAWGVPSDDTSIFWRFDASDRIEYDPRVDRDEANPGVWGGAVPNSLVFTLYGPAAIPEPSSLAMLLLTSMGCMRRQKK